MVAPLSAATLTVVYPKTNPTMYNQIIDDIKKEFEGKVSLVQVPRKLDKTALSALAADTESKKPDMVVALGSTGRKVARLFKTKVPWVSGAWTKLGPDGSSGISMIADPSVMFAKLKALSPSVKRVSVVYRRKNQWLIDLAQAAAGQFNLTLDAYKVKNLQAAIVQHNELIKKTKGMDNAVWLMYDSKTADKTYVVPQILNAAWENRFVVFSSRPAHVKRGALFSLGPDNNELGNQLVEMVEQMYKKSIVPGVKATTEVQLWVNLRTASHLGLEYTTKQKGQFHITYPRR